MATVERRLLTAVNTNKHEAVRTILAENPKIDLNKGHYINWASSLGRFEMVDLLIKAGASVNQYGMAEKETPLQSAVSHNHLSIAQRLLEVGADVNKGSLIGPSFPILKASTKAMAELLVQYKADVNVKDGKGTTVLLKAVLYKRTEVIKVLLKAGVDILCTDKDGYTPLILAVEKGYDDIVRALLEHGANPESLSPSGRPLTEIATKESTRNLLESYKTNSKLSSDYTGTIASEKTENCSETGARENIFDSMFPSSNGHIEPLAKGTVSAPPATTNSGEIPLAGLKCTEQRDFSASSTSFNPTPSAPPELRSPQPPLTGPASDRPGAERVGPNNASSAPRSQQDRQQPQQSTGNQNRGAPYVYSGFATAIPVASPLAERVAGLETDAEGTVVQAHCVVRGSPEGEHGHVHYTTTHNVGDEDRVQQLERRMGRMEALLTEQSRLVQQQSQEIRALKEQLRR